MNPLHWRYPLLVPLRLLPDRPHATLIAHACNHMLRGQSIAGRLRDLNGKIVCLRITDAPATFYFRIEGNRLHACQPGHFDVRMTGELVDFLHLATRSEDPDTLFFNRRLDIEGDTETGLHLKNLLDAIEFDWPAHVRAVLGEPAATFLIPFFTKTRVHHRR